MKLSTSKICIRIKGENELKNFQLELFENYFMEDNFQTIYASTSKEFQQQFKLKDFISVCSSYKKEITSLEKISEKDWFGSKQIFWVDQEKDKTIMLSYDDHQEITGFLLKPIISYPTDQQWTKNRYRMPINQEWFVYWGGTNEFENYHYAYKNQRYAFDLVKVKDDKTYQINPVTNENFYAFGVDVVVPFDGKVVKIVDSLDDNIPGEVDEKNPAGNYVIIMHPYKEYSFIAHFKKNSIVVKKGDMVREGQFLGQYGNSGNSSEPHIHFHVMDYPSLTFDQSIRIQFKNQLEPIQRDFVNAQLIEGEKTDRFDVLDYPFILSDFFVYITRFIDKFF